MAYRAPLYDRPYYGFYGGAPMGGGRGGRGGYGYGYAPPSSAPRRPRPERPPRENTQSQGGSSGGGGGNEVLKVAGNSQPKNLAGAVAKRLREGASVQLVAVGPASVNQAIKALAIARDYLEEGNLDFAVRPEFIHIPGGENGTDRSAMQLSVLSRPRGAPRPPTDPSGELKAANNSDPKKTAGAIAKRVRDGHRCTVVAMGASPVNQAVKSVAIARTYVAEELLDLTFKPKFIHLDMRDGDEEGTRSAIELTILYAQL